MSYSTSSPLLAVVVSTSASGGIKSYDYFHTRQQAEAWVREYADTIINVGGWKYIEVFDLQALNH